MKRERTWLFTGEASALLGCSRDTVIRLLRLGLLEEEPSLYDGARRRVTLASLVKLIRERRARKAS